MSVLTKVCVVTLMVMVLFAVPVFVTQATVPASWKTAYEKQAGYIKVLKMQGTHTQLALKQANALAAKRFAELNDLRHEMSMTVNKLESDLRSQKSSTADFSAKLDRSTANETQLQKTLDIEVRRRVVLSGHLDIARTENNRLRSATRRLEDQFKERQSEVERLGKVNEWLRFQLAERDERIKQLEEIIASGVGKKKQVVEVKDTPKIEGTITTVRGDLAGINIGSAKGVTSGMKLIIYRGSQFVAHLRVQEVGIDEAAGTIFDKRLAPLKGDKVTTTLQQ